MRLLQKLEVVAVNFQELMMLEEASLKILSGLFQPLPTGEKVVLTFKWGDLQPSSGWVLVEIASTNTDQHHQIVVPDGCDSRTWSRIVSARLQCHLLSSNRFVVVDEVSDPPKKFLSLHLERVR